MFPWRNIIPLAFFSCVFLYGYFLIKDHGILNDEVFHHGQIIRYLNGDFTRVGELTMITGYHAVIAAFAWLAGSQELSVFRLISTVISLFSVFAVYGILVRRDPEASILRTAQYVFLSILFPFFFVLYTDASSLAFLLFSWFLLERRQWVLAGIFSIVAILMRQHNVVWVFFLFLHIPSVSVLLHPFGELILHPLTRFLQSVSVLRRSLATSWRTIVRQSWVFCIAFLLFVGFLLMNGGVAIGDAEHHPFPSLFIGNILFSLFLSFFLFLPLHLAQMDRIYRLIRRHPFASLFLLTAIIIAVIFFQNDHQYNQQQFSFFLRNKLLIYLSSNWWRKILFAIPIVCAAFSHCAMRWRQPQSVFLLPLAVLYLSQSWLIEQRYYFIPFAFFLLLREREKNETEYAQLLLSVLLTIFLYDGIVNVKFFL